LIVEAITSEQMADIIPFGGIVVHAEKRARDLPALPARFASPKHRVRRFDGGIYSLLVEADNCEVAVTGRQTGTGYTLHTVWLTDTVTDPDAHHLADWAAEMCMRTIDASDQVCSTAGVVFDDWRQVRERDAA